MFDPKVLLTGSLYLFGDIGGQFGLVLFCGERMGAWTKLSFSMSPEGRPVLGGVDLDSDGCIDLQCSQNRARIRTQPCGGEIRLWVEVLGEQGGRVLREPVVCLLIPSGKLLGPDEIEALPEEERCFATSELSE